MELVRECLRLSRYPTLDGPSIPWLWNIPSDEDPNHYPENNCHHVAPSLEYFSEINAPTNKVVMRLLFQSIKLFRYCDVTMS